MVLLYKLINNYTHIDESGLPIIAESGKTRRETDENVIRFVIPFAKTVTYQSSYLIRPCKTWNVLNSDLCNRDIGLQAFKSGLKTYYITNTRYPIFIIMTIRELGNLCALNVKG
jgi:hypothetical protein